MNLFQRIHDFIKKETAVHNNDSGATSPPIDTEKITQGVIDIHAEHAAETTKDDARAGSTEPV